MSNVINTESLILSHLTNHEGQTPGEIADAIGRTSGMVRRTLQTMTELGQVWRDEYTRYFTSIPDACKDMKFIEMSHKAYGYQDNGMWNCAADAWLKAFDCTKNPGLREKAITCRKACIAEANRRIPKPEPDPFLGRSYS